MFGSQLMNVVGKLETQVSIFPNPCFEISESRSEKSESWACDSYKLMFLNLKTRVWKN